MSNKVINFACSCFLLLSLILNTGCDSLINSDKPDSKQKTPPFGPNISAQMVFDHAALGPGKTDLAELKSFYNSAINDTAKANSLSGIKDANKDYFIHKLLLLPATDITKNILLHFTNNLSNPPNAINPIDSSKQPLAILTDPARSVNGDQAIELQEMIKILADKGDDKTIAAADANGLKVILDAVLAKGNKALITKVLNGADVTKPAIKTAMFNWVVSKKADIIAGSTDTVEMAFLAATTAKNSANNQDIVDEVARGPIGPGGTDLVKLSMFYDLVVRGDASGAAAAALANQAASTPTLDRFPNYLSNLVPDTQILAIWIDYLAKIANHGGAAAVGSQVQFLGASLISPLSSVLTKADTQYRNQIIQLMISRNRAVLAASVTALEVPAFLTALRQEEGLADFMVSFNALLAVNKEECIDWANANQAQTLPREAGTPTIAVAMNGVFTVQMVVDEAAKGALANIDKLKFLYEVAIKTDATGAKATALAAQAPSAGGPDRFSHFLAGLPINADIVNLWDNYLSNIFISGSNLAVLTQVSLPGAVSTPLNLVLAQAKSSDRDDIIRNMIMGNIAAGAATVDAGKIAEFLTVLCGSQLEIDFINAFTVLVADPAKKADAFAWFAANKDEVVAPGRIVLEAIVANNVITTQMVVDQAERAGTNLAEVPLLKLLYDVAIRTDTTGAKATTLAAQAPSAGGPDRFSHFLAKLTPNGDIADLWDDYVSKIKKLAGGNLGTAVGDNAAATALAQQLNLPGTANTPLNLVLAQAKSDLVDQIISHMISNYRVAALATVDEDKIDKFLTVLIEKKDAFSLFKAFLAIIKDPDPLKRLKASTWFRNNKDTILANEGFEFKYVISDKSVDIDDQILVNQAADAVNNAGYIDLLEYLYQEKIVDNNQAIAIKDLVSTIGGYTFIASLAKINDLRTKKILVYYLDKIRTVDPAVFGQEINKIDVANIAILLEAFKEYGTVDLMASVFNQITDATKLNQAIAWAMANRISDINASTNPNEVLMAMRASNVIDYNMLLNEVNKADGVVNWKKVLFYVQVLAYDEASALALAMTDTAGTLLHNLIVAKTQTAESVKALKYYLSFLGTVNWKAIRDNNAGGNLAQNIIKLSTHPDYAHLNLLKPHQIKNALGIFQLSKWNAPKPKLQLKLNPPKADPIVNQAP